MIFKYELRFVAFTWPNLCLWIVINLCPAFVKLNPKNLKPKTLKNVKKLGFHQPCRNGDATS